MKEILHKWDIIKTLSFQVKRSEIEESTHQFAAKQENSAKILRLAALAQDDSLFLIWVFRIINYLNETAPGYQGVSSSRPVVSRKYRSS